jgi:hypothetical protein
MATRVFSDVREVVEYCKDRYGDADYVFRGQRQPWPLKASIFRIKDEKRRAAKWQQTMNFCLWMLSNGRLQPFHEPKDALLAIAQHYGYATDLIDFTRDVEIAAYFATSGHIDASQPGAIFLTKIRDFQTICAAYRIPGAFYFLEVFGLWRLEAQKGVFMHDWRGFVSQRPEEAVEEVLLFKQHEGVTVTTSFPEVTRRRVHPPPNDLEREIQGYRSVAIRSGFEQRVQGCFPDAKTVYLERDPVGIDVEDESPYLDWTCGEGNWAEIDQTPLEQFPRSDTAGGCVQIFFDAATAILDGALQDHVDVVAQLRRDAPGASSTMPMISVVLGPRIQPLLEGRRGGSFVTRLRTKLAELIGIMVVSPFSVQQVARAIQNCFALAVHSNQTRVQDAEKCGTAGAFQTDDLVEVEYADFNRVVSRTHVPAVCFDTIEAMFEVRRRFNRRYPGLRLRRNCQVLQFVHNIRKLMSAHDAVDLWATIVLPSQVLFRDRTARALNPFSVEGIGYA